MNSKRLQSLNGDTVLDITEPTVLKVRLSEKDLLRRKAYLEESITKFQERLADTEGKLSQIYDEQSKARK